MSTDTLRMPQPGSQPESQPGSQNGTQPGAQPGAQASPNRVLAFIAYLIPLVGPLIALLAGRKNRFALYHACQALGWLFVAIAVPVLWIVLGWIVTFFSVQAPELYIIPIAALLLVPVWQRRKKAVRYAERWSWVNIGLTLVVALALIYGCYLVLRWLAPLVLPLAGQLLLMSGFSVVIAAYLTLLVGWIVGMINALRGREKPIPVFGGWGDRLYARLGGEQP